MPYVEKPRAERKEESPWQKFFTYTSDIMTGALKSQAEIRKTQIEQQSKMQQVRESAGLHFLQSQYEMREREAQTMRQLQEREAIAKRAEVRKREVRTEEDILKETREIQNKAMEDFGVAIAIDPKRPPREQLRIARTLYAQRLSELPVAPTSKPTKPTWAQEQKVASIKTGLQRGEVTIGRQFGEPTTYPIRSLADALRAISDAGLDPALFGEELTFYQNVITTAIDNETGRIAAKLRDGRVIWLDTREEVPEEMR